MDKFTALVETPLFSTHLKIPPPLWLIIKSSPKLSCVHNLSWLVDDNEVEEPNAPSPHPFTPQPVPATKTSRPTFT